LARVKVLPPDALKRQTPTLVEPPGTTLEETPVNGAPFGPREIGTAEVLEGPDRDNCVVGARRFVVPPILEPHFYPLRRRRGARLVRAQSQPGDVAHMAFARQVSDHGPPTAPDIERPCRAVGFGTRRVPLELCRLRCFQIVIERAGPKRAGVHEPLPKPEAVEVAADVIVVLDRRLRGSSRGCRHVALGGQDFAVSSTTGMTRLVFSWYSP